MRRRLLLSMVAVVAVAVMLFALPLVLIVGALMRDEANQQLYRETTILTAEVDQRLEHGQALLPADISEAYPGRHVVIVLPGNSGTVTAGPSGFAHSISVTLRGGSTAQVTMSRDARAVDERVLRTRLGIIGLALVAVGVAVTLGVWQARRLTLPLNDLVITAERLGSGSTRPRGHRYGVPELDQVAAVLDSAAERVAELLRNEREFATEASHQLRTPLTAMSMRLEEIIASAEEPAVVREEGAAALAQTERLAEVVEHLLSRARRTRTLSQQHPVSVDEVLGQQAEGWAPAFRRANRSIVVTGQRGLVARATPAGVTQVISTLVENALVHGEGTVTLKAERTGKSVVMEVSDEGPGVPPKMAAQIFERQVSGGGGGLGVGLAIARDLAEGDGGRLELVRNSPPAFAVFLRPNDPDDPDEPTASP